MASTFTFTSFAGVVIKLLHTYRTLIVETNIVFYCDVTHDVTDPLFIRRLNSMMTLFVGIADDKNNNEKFQQAGKMLLKLVFNSTPNVGTDIQHFSTPPPILPYNSSVPDSFLRTDKQNRTFSCGSRKISSKPTSKSVIYNSTTPKEIIPTTNLLNSFNLERQHACDYNERQKVASSNIKPISSDDDIYGDERYTMVKQYTGSGGAIHSRNFLVKYPEFRLTNTSTASSQCKRQLLAAAASYGTF